MQQTIGDPIVDCLLEGPPYFGMKQYANDGEPSESGSKQADSKEEHWRCYPPEKNTINDEDRRVTGKDMTRTQLLEVFIRRR